MNTDKIELLKDTIEILYTKEGKSLNYISNLLKINRKGVTNKVKEWGFVSPQKHLVPSKQKFLNKNKDLIKSMFENNYTQKENYGIRQYSIWNNYARVRCFKTS